MIKIQNIEELSEAHKDEAVALLEKRCDLSVPYGTEIKDMFHKGNAVIMAMKDEAGKLVGASFSVLHKGNDGLPPVAMYTYEACPPGSGAELFNETKKAIEEKLGSKARIFLEGDATQRKADESRGFRRIRYDTKDYKWCDGDYKWMVHGDAAPTRQEMETVIHLQRRFVVGAECPMDINPSAPLDKQVEGISRLDYGVDESVAHAGKKAVNGMMTLENPLKQQSARGRE